MIFLLLLYCIVFYCISLYFIVFHCFVLYCILLYFTVLYCIFMYCICIFKIFRNHSPHKFRIFLTHSADCKEFDNAKLLRDKKNEIISKMVGYSEFKRNN